MAITKIQWTAASDGTPGYTFNPWIGCAKVAPECRFCYAETLMDHRYHKVEWGKGKPRVRTSEANWKLPLRWDREAKAAGVRSKVFCASLSDWLDDEVPIDWFCDLLSLIKNTPNLDWLLLTKRPQNFEKRTTDAMNRGGSPLAYQWRVKEPPTNVWIGVSAGADQQAALDIPAKIHFLSCEPMLAPWKPIGGFDWVIFGGESGAHARSCDIQWIRNGLEYCRTHGIAPFVKQLGARPKSQNPNCTAQDDDIYWTLKDGHGGDMSEWPEDLRVREFPV